MTVELIRHGSTALQSRGCYQGRRTDVPLSPEGIAALCPAELPPERVYTTGLRRTAETAALLFPGAERIAVPALEEMDFGRFEGKNFEELSDDPDYRAWVEGGCLGRCPGGESKEEFCRRVCCAFSDLLDGAREERVVIVAHSGTLMAALERYALPRRDYFSWHVPCGAGYLLDASAWRGTRRLTLLGERNYCKE